MLHWNAYLDVQNGADSGAANNRSHLPRRFIDTPRDLATYVRFDQLYQAYLNACFFMLDKADDFKFQQPTLTDGNTGPGFNETEAEPVTISGELNKLAANISIARNMAGVHYYADYYESLRMGMR